MKKFFGRLFVILMAVLMGLSVFAGCGGRTNGGDPDDPDDPTEEKAENPMVEGEPYGEGRTLNIYMPGTKPAELDNVLKEFKKRTADIFAFDVEFKFDPLDTYKQNLTLNIGSSDDLDLVFDAQWIYLQEWSQNGNYIKLDKYFENPEFPGLQKAFDSTYLKNNEFNDGIYGIPLMESFGVTNAAYYRLDWCKEAAKNNPAKYAALADGIDTSVEAELYLYYVKEAKSAQGVVPLLANKDGFGPYNLAAGFYDEGDNITIQQSNEMGVRKGWQLVNNGGVSFSVYVNPETLQVEGIYCPQYEDPVELNNFPALFASENAHVGNWQSTMEKVRTWYEDGLISSNVLNESDAESKFRMGQGGMVLRSLEQYVPIAQALKQNAEEGENPELEIFMYSKAEREMVQPQFGTDFKAWNYLAIPKTSPDADLAILFMDWLFDSRDNHDLFQYGIEGVHWHKVDPVDGEGEYMYESGDVLYDMPAYQLTWNPNYTRLPKGASEKTLKYLRYCQDTKSYAEVLYSDFRFNDVPVSSELKNPNFGVYATQMIPYQLGTRANPVAEYSAIIDERINNTKFQEDLLIIKEEFRYQLQEYLDSL